MTAWVELSRDCRHGGFDGIDCFLSQSFRVEKLRKAVIRARLPALAQVGQWGMGNGHHLYFPARTASRSIRRGLGHVDRMRQAWTRLSRERHFQRQTRKPPEQGLSRLYESRNAPIPSVMRISQWARNRNALLLQVKPQSQIVKTPSTHDLCIQSPFAWLQKIGVRVLFETLPF